MKIKAFHWTFQNGFCDVIASTPPPNPCIGRWDAMIGRCGVTITSFILIPNTTHLGTVTTGLGEPAPTLKHGFWKNDPVFLGWLREALGKAAPTGVTTLKTPNYFGFPLNIANSCLKTKSGFPSTSFTSS
jgi:hypothetical protein